MGHFYLHMRMWLGTHCHTVTIQHECSLLRCRCLYVDEANQLLLAATADKCAHVFDLSAGFVPLAR